jgi:3-dehydroquinate dehydratase/shikimate dehydrogenase
LRRERGYVDLAELRADFLRPDELASLVRFPALADVPVILTLRRAQDGGRWRGAEADRRRLLREALGGRQAARPEGPVFPGGRRYAFVEVEEGLDDPVLEEAARACGCRLIRSYYNLRGVPADLAARVRRLARAAGARESRPGGLPKAEVRVRGSRDQLRLAEAFRELQGVEKVLLGMGEFGSFSRILAGRLGSWLACCSAGGGGTAVNGEAPPAGAPGTGETEAAEAGQLDPRTLVELYRFRQVGPSTAVYGVVGNPIAHSRSPHLHNPGFAALGLDAVYVPFLADEFPAFLRAAEALGVRGLSVTVPFKQRALRLAHRAARASSGSAEAEARVVGAANTLLAGGARAGGGRRRPAWQAANTDVEGFLAPLEREAPDLLRAAGGGLHAGDTPTGDAPPGETPVGRGATVLGAGGAARAVVYALRRRGLRVLVLNRTPARARALARRFGCEWGGLDPRGMARLSAGLALIVQATTVGLDGAGDPLPDYVFRGTEVVYDLVYGRWPTPFLRRAQAAGCRTISGEQMLRAQAAAQFRLFTGRELPQP